MGIINLYPRQRHLRLLKSKNRTINRDKQIQPLRGKTKGKLKISLLFSSKIEFFEKGSCMPYVRTTYTDEAELIGDMLGLYNGGKTVELDPCYSIGRFWNNFEKPKLKFDLIPQVEGVMEADCTNLPLANDSINSIMFDPPFMIGIGKSASGILTKRFSGFKSLQELQNLYSRSLIEFRRILNKDGLIFFKCQDTVTSGKQFFAHIFIINMAIAFDYIAEDLFVLVRNRAMIDPKWNGQKHARKTHSYFLVLRKK